MMSSSVVDSSSSSCEDLDSSARGDGDASGSDESKGSSSGLEGLVGSSGSLAGESSAGSASGGAGASSRAWSSASGKRNTDGDGAGLSSAIRSISRRLVSTEAGPSSLWVLLVKPESEVEFKMAEGASTLSVDPSRGSWEEKEMSETLRFKSSSSASTESSTSHEGEGSRGRSLVFGDWSILVEGGGGGGGRGAGRMGVSPFC